MQPKKHIFIRIGAFTLLLLGLLLSGGCIALGIALVILYPEGDTAKIFLTSGACFGFGVLILLPSVALFELMLSFVRLEHTHIKHHGGTPALQEQHARIAENA